MKTDTTPWAESSPYEQAVRIGFNAGLEKAAQHLIDEDWDYAHLYAKEIRSLKEPTK